MSPRPEGWARRFVVLKDSVAPSPGFSLGTLGLLALVVSACGGRGTQPTATQAVLDSADQVLIGMTHYVTETGLQRARVQADTAYFFSNTQTAELRNVHITFYDAHGAETSTLTAREGTYHWRTQDMEGRGNVVVVRNSDGGTLHTETMRYSQSRNAVTADPDFRNVATKQLTGTGGQLVLPHQ